MTAPLHPNIPVGYWAAHPPGYVQSVDPGAVGAHKIWCDTSTTPYTWKIRNADNSAWVAIVGPTVYAGQAALEAVEAASIASDAGLDARLVAIEEGGAPPETHASTHAAAGADPVTLATSQVTGLDTVVAAGAGQTFGLSLPMSGGGAAIPTGVYGYLEIPVACTITAVRLVTPTAASLVIDLWKDSYANWPPTVADTITASAKPTLSATPKHENTTLTGWTKTLAAGSWLAINVDSGDATTATLSLRFVRT